MMDSCFVRYNLILSKNGEKKIIYELFFSFFLFSFFFFFVQCSLFLFAWYIYEYSIVNYTRLLLRLYTYYLHPFFRFNPLSTSKFSFHHTFNIALHFLFSFVKFKRRILISSVRYILLLFMNIYEGRSSSSSLLSSSSSYFFCL